VLSILAKTTGAWTNLFKREPESVEDWKPNVALVLLADSLQLLGKGTCRMTVSKKIQWSFSADAGATLSM
jgi:hypothetical protein